MRREGRALISHVRATPPDSPWCSLQKGRGSNNPCPPCMHWDTRGCFFSNVHDHTLAEPCLSALFLTPSSFYSDGEKGLVLCQLPPFPVSPNRKLPSATQPLLHRHFPFPTPKSSFWGILWYRIKRTQKNRNREAEDKREEFRPKNEADLYYKDLITSGAETGRKGDNQVAKHVFGFPLLAFNGCE